MKVRTCSACGHQFAKRWWGWNAVDVRNERCRSCDSGNGYGSELCARSHQRKERRSQN